MEDRRRILDFPGLFNARDLGGYPTRSGAHTRWRAFVRADDLVQLTPAGVQAIAQFGVATVVDLRWPSEVALAPHPVPRDLARVRYHQISLLVADENEWGALSAGCVKEMWKCAVLDHTRTQLRQVLEVLADASPGPLLFHCVAGKDRTGILAALLLALAEVTPEAIAHDYAASSEQLREAYLRRYPEVPAETITEIVRCPPEGVYNMLGYLERYGGVAGFFEEIGLSGESIARLRARLAG